MDEIVTKIDTDNKELVVINKIDLMKRDAKNAKESKE